MEKKALLAIAFISTLLTSAVAGNYFVHPVRASPEPIPPSITVHSPTNNAVINSTSVSLSFTLSLPAIQHDQYGLWVYSTVSWVGYAVDDMEKITIQNTTIRQNTSAAYVGPQKAVGFAVNLTSLAEGPHQLVVIAAYSSFYPAIVNSSSPIVLGYSDTINFIVNTAYPEVSILSLKNETYAKPEFHLNFTINEPVSWIGYSLDGQENVTITGNTTLSGLSNGLHSIIIYANDTVGNVGGSEPVTFFIKEPFPTTLVIVSIITVVVISIVLLFDFKKRKR